MSSRPAHGKKPRFNPYNGKQYFRGGRKNFLEVGHRGFLATCNFKEKECVRECFNILNEYADELYGPQLMHKNTEDPGCGSTAEKPKDITDELQQEIADTVPIGAGKVKDATKQHRFFALDTTTANCVFIKTTLTDPVKLGQHIITDIAKTREQKARFLLRLLPIEAVCRANMDDILKTAGELCDKYFLENGCTYSIVFNKRYNNDIKRDEVINALAELVKSKNVNNKVDLTQPDKSVVVEVIKGKCCITVVEGYIKYKKYNLFELANAEVANAEPLNKPLESKRKAQEDPKTADVTETEETDQNVSETNPNEDKNEK